jgi:hypothetical protein
MTDCGDIALRNDILVLDRNNVFLRKDGKGCIAESYIKYIDYFYQRCKAIGVQPWDMEGLLFKNSAVKQHFLELIGNPVHYEPVDNNVVLKVYNVPGNNYGKTFQILNNRVTLPHNADEVYLEYDGQLLEARLGSYSGGGNTLRGKDSIKKLIEDNRWSPGQEFQAVFHIKEEGQHVYEIIR